MRESGVGKISVYLDEKLQVIRQRLDGNIDDETATKFVEESRAAAALLRDPKKIRVLAVSNNLGKGTPAARRMLMENLDNEDVYRVALVGKNPFMNAAVSFFLAIKPSKKIRVFGNEDEALLWLNE
jgi:hypothetical protein